MLNYLDESQLRQGLRQAAEKTGGVAYLELFTSDDAFEGDTSWPEPRSTGWYRRLIRKAALHSIGMHCYIPAHRAELVASLERV
jgi:hypothetical protein